MDVPVDMMPGFILGGLLFFARIGLFIVCRIFEPTIIKRIDKKQ